jgi:hypothetical protein
VVTAEFVDKLFKFFTMVFWKFVLVLIPLQTAVIIRFAFIDETCAFMKEALLTITNN